MRVLLHDTQNGLYYLGPSNWTPERDEALDLEQSARALELAFQSGLKTGEILLCYEDPRFDIALPFVRSRPQA